MEWDGRNLEPEPNQDQENRRRTGDVTGEPSRASAAKNLADRIELRGARHAVDEAQAKQKHRRRYRPVDEVLQTALSRPPSRLFQRGAQVEADRHCLKGQEQGDK